jgi:hypothetical protein
MFSFQDRHLWEKHRSIPSRSLEYAERTELWGYWKYSTDLLNASDDDDLSISMDFIWFEFNLNLLAKIIHYDMLEFRLYALDAVDQLLTGGDQYRALKQLMRSVSFGTELSDDPNTLSNKFLVSLTDKLQEI